MRCHIGMLNNVDDVAQTLVVGNSGGQQGLSGYAASPCVSVSSLHRSIFSHRSCSAASPSYGLARCGPARPETQTHCGKQNKQCSCNLNMDPIHLDVETRTAEFTLGVKYCMLIQILPKISQCNE